MTAHNEVETQIIPILNSFQNKKTINYYFLTSMKVLCKNVFPLFRANLYRIFVKSYRLWLLSCDFMKYSINNSCTVETTRTFCIYVTEALLIYIHRPLSCFLELFNCISLQMKSMYVVVHYIINCALDTEY